MRYAETLLLIYYKQSELFVLHRLLQQLVRSYYYIDFAAFKLLDYDFLLCGRTEPRQHRNAYRIVAHSLPEIIIVLIRKYGRRHKVCHLISAHNRLERRTHCHLGLSVAYIAAKQTFHRARLFHIRLDLGDTAQLVVRFLIRERRLKVMLPLGIVRKPYSVHCVTLRVKLYKLLCHVLARRFCPLFCLVPLLTAEPVQLNLLRVRSDVLVYQIKLIRRHIKTVAALIYNFKIIA